MTDGIDGREDISAFCNAVAYDKKSSRQLLTRQTLKNFGRVQSRAVIEHEVKER